MLVTATVFASNHVAARLAFDHGTSVATAVTIRSATTVLVGLFLLGSTGTPLRMPAATLRRAVLIGLLLSVQSYCLYAAVARLPVALALLTFNLFPVLLASITWAASGQRPGWRTLVAMPVILVGLTMALNIFGPGTGTLGAAQEPTASRWAGMSAGIGFALAAAASFSVALFLTTRWLGGMDGRLRAVITMATVGLVVLFAGLIAGASGLVTGSPGGSAGIPAEALAAAFSLPDSPRGWIGLALLSALYTVGFTTLFALLPRLGAANNAPILNFEPIAALLLGYLILDQKVLPVQMGGALLVIGAIVFLTTGPRR